MHVVAVRQVVLPFTFLESAICIVFVWEPRELITGALLSYHYCVRWCKLLCNQCVIPCVLLSVTTVIPFPIVAVSHCPSRCIGAAVASIGSVITRVYPDQLRLLWSLYTFTGSVYCCLFVFVSFVVFCVTIRILSFPLQMLSVAILFYS